MLQNDILHTVIVASVFLYLVFFTVAVPRIFVVKRASPMLA
jgi:hypothetical protein